MVATDEYWSPIPLFILFRESIEAAIIVAVLLQFLNRTGPWLKKQVWWGVFMGVACSIGVGIIFICMYYKAQNDIFRGRNQLIFKGACSWLAAILIGMLGFAMLRFMGWEEKWQRRLRVMAQKVQDNEKAAISDLAENGGGPPMKPVTWSHTALHYLSCGFVSKDPNVPSSAQTACQAFGDKTKASYNASMTKAKVGCTSGLNKMLGRTDTAESEGEKPRPTHTTPNWFQRVVLKQQPRPLTEEELLAQDDRAQKLVEYAKNKVLHDMLPPSQRYQLFILAFVTVLREGLETMIFLAGVGNAKPTAIPLPGIVGIICGVTVGVLLYYTGKQIKDIYMLMVVMATFIFFIGAGQAELGANNLMVAGAFGTFITAAGLPVPTAEYRSMGLLPVNGAAAIAGGGAAAQFNDGDEIDYSTVVAHDDLYTNPKMIPQPWYFGKLWDISGCCSDQDNENRFLALMNKIFGYNAKPTFIDVAGYCGFWILVLLLMLWKLHNGTLLDADYKHTREVKAKQRQAEREAALAKGIILPPEPQSLSARIKAWVAPRNETNTVDMQLSMQHAHAK